ncbi:MAG: VirB3 family type IV secretion system protein [Campylobacter sp.]|nr:VirB3 family type IV secretion system protein [Campylobacter sp.]
MQTEPVYKALTRPAMVFGVPVIPLLLMLMFWFLLALLLQAFLHNALYLLLSLFILPNLWIFQQIVKSDDMAFRLWGLKFMNFSGGNIATKFYDGNKSYMANSTYAKMPIENDFPKLSVVGLHSFPNFEKLIPYQSLANDVVITKDGDYLASWRVDGIAFEVEDDDFIDMDKNKLNMLVRQFSGQSVSFYFHNARMNIEIKPKHHYENNEFLKNLSNKYYKIFNKENLKENKLYFTAIYSPLKDGGKVNQTAYKKANDIDKKIKQIQIHLKEFRQICTTIEQNLGKFKPYRLGIYEVDGVKFSSQLEFYNYLLGARFSKVRVPNGPLDNYLNGNLNEIFPTQHTLQLNYNDGSKKFAKAIELKDYPNESFSGIFDKLMYANVEYTITQSFIPKSKKAARDDLEKQQKRLVASEDSATNQVLDIDNALESLQDDVIFGEYHFSIVIFSESQVELNKISNKIAVILQDLGFLSTHAGIALEATYFAQIPANFALRPRIHTISSKNYASFIALHNFPRGKKDGNAWGEAITILQTPNKQPFFFNIHETHFDKDDFGKNDILANTFVLGKSGGGKTVIMNFMLDMLCKFNEPETFADDTPSTKRKATYFYLDKDKGAIGNIIALGGNYITIKSGRETGFNPFYCEATPENTRRIKVLMKMLVTKGGVGSLTTREEEQLNFAVDSIMRLPKESRTYGVSKLIQLIQAKNDEINSLQSRLRAWTSGSEFGWVFDNEVDTLDFSDENITVYGIDGTDLLKDDEISPYVAYYILWRIVDMVDGRRFGLFIDEAWDWLKNRVVMREVHNKEKTIRKENGFLFLGTQSVEDIAKSEVGTAIVEQSETILLLSNPKAKRNDYCGALNMSEEEYNFVKTTSPESYQFLIKKDVSYRAIATINLAHIGNMVKVLSTAKVYVNELEEINEMDISREEKYEKIKELYKID